MGPLRAISLLAVCLSLCATLHAQTSSSPPLQTHSSAPVDPLPSAPFLPLVNGQPYRQPNQHDLIVSYLHDTYGLQGAAATVIRASYSQARDRPTGWGQDLSGFGQRFGSSSAVTAINGTVRLGFESVLHEDLRYLPCHRCTVKRKIANALLAEITARHGPDGHRTFTLTPTVSDFSGPILTHVAWYPGNASAPIEGVIAARTVFATRIGLHLAREFLLDRPRKPREPLTPTTDVPPRP